MDYTITLTDAQVKSLAYVAYDPKDWIQNAATTRSDLAKKEIIQLNTEHCNSNSIQLAVGEDAQVTQAYTLGVVKTLKAETDEYMANLPGMAS